MRSEAHKIRNQMFAKPVESAVLGSETFPIPVLKKRGARSRKTIDDRAFPTEPPKSSHNAIGLDGQGMRKFSSS
jgi:hypothetical protein